MKNIFPFIFKVDRTHHFNDCYIFFNAIKITLKKKKYAEKVRDIFKYFNTCKNNKINITTIKPITGELREIQLALVAMLLDLNSYCKENNIKYWLDFGTLIGAIRHKGFIPWDDDIDVGMIRNDYETFIEKFNVSKYSSDLVAEYVFNSERNYQCFIKVFHKKNRNLFIDIFPVDFYNRKLSIEEKQEKTSLIKNILKKMEKEENVNLSIDETIDKNHNITEKEIKEISTIREDNPSVFWGIDFHHRWNQWFYDYDVIFPLKTTKFEGYDLPIINDPHSYLSEVYGDYMAYPKKIGFGHNMSKTMTDGEKQIVLSLITKLEEERINV